MVRHHAILLVAAALIAIVPLFMGYQGEDVFGGADNRASATIHEIRPDYQPWFTPLWQPPSGEIASLLFALQAALGAGFLGYYLGLRRGETKAQGRAANHGDH